MNPASITSAGGGNYDVNDDDNDDEIEREGEENDDNNDERQREGQELEMTDEDEDDEDNNTFQDDVPMTSSTAYRVRWVSEYGYENFDDTELPFCNF